MNSQERNEKLIVNKKMQFNELIKRIKPNPKLFCIRLCDEPSDKNNPKTKNNLGHCDVIEIITHIPINTRNLNKFIIEAGYTLFDVTYEPDGLHFLVRRVGERAT